MVYDQRLRLYRKRLASDGGGTGTPFIITGNQSGPVGVPVLVTLEAVGVQQPIWSLQAGSSPNCAVNGIKWTLFDFSVAGAFSCTVIVTDGVTGAQVTKILTWTLEASGGTLGAISDLSAPSSTTTTITLAFTAVPGAQSYKYSIDGQDAVLADLAANKVITGRSASVSYLIKVFAAKAPGIVGAASNSIIAATQDLANAGPNATQLAVRARTLTNCMTIQFRLHFTEAKDGYKFWANATGAQSKAAVNNTGWIKKYFEPLILVGIKGFRTPQGSGAASAMSTQVIQYLSDTYGCKVDVAVNNTVNESPSTKQLIDLAHTNYPNAVRCFMGKNEPNTNPPETDKWATDVIEQQVVIESTVRSYSDWQTLPLVAFPIKLRDPDAITWLLGFTTPSGKKWLTHCAPGLARGNIHWYPQGLKATICGTELTTDSGEKTMDQVIVDHQRLAPGRPCDITEAGYQSIPVPPATVTNQMLTENARAKYCSHLAFDCLERGINNCTFFELLSTIADVHPYPLVDHSVTGGVVTFTTLRVYTTLLNLATVLYDNHVNAETFTPGSLNFALSDDVSAPGGYNQDIRHWHMQKNSDGKHYIAIWYDWSSWKRSASAEDFRSRTVKLTLNASAAVAQCRPYNDAIFTSLGSGVTFVLDVPDDVLIIRVG